MYPAAGQPLPGGYPPPYWGQLPPRPALRNELGTAALWLAVCGAALFWFPAVGLALGIAAIVTGIVGWTRIRRGQANNRGTAFTGIVLGTVVSIIGAVILAASIFFISMYISYENCIDHAQGRSEYAQC